MWVGGWVGVGVCGWVGVCVCVGECGWVWVDVCVCVCVSVGGCGWVWGVGGGGVFLKTFGRGAWTAS